MTDPLDFDDPDKADQFMIDNLAAQGIDITQVMPVSAHLGFFSEQAARQAAVELLLAGYPTAKVEPTGVRPIPLLTLASWTTTVIANMAPTLDAMRSMRIGLTEFAGARGGTYSGGGVVGVAPETDEWANVDPGATDEAAPDDVDQDVVDYLFAYNADLKLAMTLSAGLHYSAEDVARQAAAALIGAGYGEVRVSRANVGWTVAVDAYLVPEVAAIRALRLNLTKFAQSGGGSWAGCRTDLTMPKTFGEAPA